MRTLLDVTPEHKVVDSVALCVGCVEPLRGCASTSSL